MTPELLRLLARTTKLSEPKAETIEPDDSALAQPDSGQNSRPSETQPPPGQRVCYPSRTLFPAQPNPRNLQGLPDTHTPTARLPLKLRTLAATSHGKNIALAEIFVNHRASTKPSGAVDRFLWHKTFPVSPIQKVP